MNYSSGNYEAFARPKKPAGVDSKSAYIVGSGLAALVMPLMGPLAQMTGVTMQTAVIAFQCAAGFSDCIIPTSSTTNACIGAGNVNFVQWFRFAIKLALIEWGLSIVCFVIANMLQLA